MSPADEMPQRDQKRDPGLPERFEDTKAHAAAIGLAEE